MVSLSLDLRDKVCPNKMTTQPVPLNRRSFLIVFVSLCVAVVPVVAFSPFVVTIEPVSALLLDIFRVAFKRPSSAFLSILFGIHALVYTGAFTAIGAAAYFLIWFLPWRAAQWFAIAALLSLPVICSFARVLTYSSIAGAGGTYTFLEAIDRYFEKH